MKTLIMSVFTGVFLLETILTIISKDFQKFLMLHSFRVPENSSMITGKRNAIECCFECVKVPACIAVNFHTGDNACELLEQGTVPLYPYASTGWTFHYTDTKHLYHFFNAIASQKSTYLDIDVERGVSGVAELGIDGNTDPYYYNGSCFHTGKNTAKPWWMVNLFLQFRVESVILWNRLDDGCGIPCYNKLRDLTITVSPTLGAVDDPDNVCATYLGPPSFPNENPVVVNCSQAMLGRYIKIQKRTNGFLYLCEVDFA